MPEFLSDAWLGALDERAPAALRRCRDVAPFVIEQVVTDGAAETVGAYHLVFSADGTPGRARVPRPNADVSFATDLDTATRLARGETNAQRALAAGRFRVHGNIDALTQRVAGLARARRRVRRGSRRHDLPVASSTWLSCPPSRRVE